MFKHIRLVLMIGALIAGACVNLYVLFHGDFPRPLPDNEVSVTWQEPEGQFSKCD